MQISGKLNYKFFKIKVRFQIKMKKRTKDGKPIFKYKWYGGVVVGVGEQGRQIRIQYDDGTTEITGFPDKEIVVDDEENGKHDVPADAFLPRQPMTKGVVVSSSGRYNDDDSGGGVDVLDGNGMSKEQRRQLAIKLEGTKFQNDNTY